MPITSRAAADTSTGAGGRRGILRVLPGLAPVLVIAGVATWFGTIVPVVGAPVTAILLGLAVAAVRRPAEVLRPGIAFAGKAPLQLAVVLLGAQLSLAQVARVGLSSLPVMIGTLAVCLLLAWLVGRRMGVSRDLRTLIGVGTGVCGASAIAAVTPVIEAAGVEVAYAISTIFVCNVAAVLVFPLLGHALGMGQQAFGLFAGTAVNDTSSVVAAATIYGAEATHHAVVVKLTRTLMIIPIVLGLAARNRRTRDGTGRAPRITSLVPWFLVGFLVLAGVNSAGLLPVGLRSGMGTASTLLITAALAGIGLSIDIGGIRRTGPRPLLLGVLLWLAVSVTSLGLQWLLPVSMAR